MVSLIENHYSADPPANASGQRPFEDRRLVSLLPFGTVADFTMPNEAYFAYADWVLRRAAEKGVLVLLAPSYVGCCGDGWYDAMVANGPDRLHRYGEYLGRRYRSFANILWVHAGDTNRRRDLVGAIAAGIRQVDPRALHTTHGRRRRRRSTTGRASPGLRSTTSIPMVRFTSRRWSNLRTPSARPSF